jgi:L-lactate dehydrogenase complex protein LldG
MSDARTEILEKIRRAVAPRPAGRAADYAAIARHYRQSGSLDRAACLDLLEERLHDYGAGVYRASRADLPAAIAQAAAACGKTRLLIPGALPPEWPVGRTSRSAFFVMSEWLPDSVEFLPAESAGYDDLDRAEGALTGCAAAIATTGTIVLRHSAAEGRRALTLVPDYHLCIVFADQVVETVPEALRLMHAAGARLLTTIAGPSATADIEMTRIQGVHGPRTLDVVLVVQ